MKSIVRLMHLRSVVLPELDGPMMPKILSFGISRLTLSQRGLGSIPDRHVAKGNVGRHGPVYHLFRDRRNTRNTIVTMFTARTRPKSTTATPYWRLSETPVTWVEIVKRW